MPDVYYVPLPITNIVIVMGQSASGFLTLCGKIRIISFLDLSVIGPLNVNITILRVGVQV